MEIMVDWNMPKSFLAGEFAIKMWQYSFFSVLDGIQNSRQALKILKIRPDVWKFGDYCKNGQ